MKGIQLYILIGTAIVSVYFLYLAAINIFVYFANRSMGHQESFLASGRNLAIGGILAFLVVGSYYLLKSPNYARLGAILLYLPIGLVLLYVIWAIIIIVSAGGRWN